MDFTEIFNQLGISLSYAIVLLFGGVWGINNITLKMKTQSKYDLCSLIIACIFIAIEVFIQKTFKTEDATKYFVGYFVASIGYRMFMKKIFQKWGWVEEDVKK